eukprot:gene10336-7230_t
MTDSSTSDATPENIQKLMTALLRDRYCRPAYNDLDACNQNFVFEPRSSSYIEESLLRQAVKKCIPFRDAYQKCLENEKNQSTVLKQALKVPACRHALGKLQRCQRMGKSGCEREAEETIFCGLSYMVASGEVPLNLGAPNQRH